MSRNLKHLTGDGDTQRSGQPTMLLLTFFLPVLKPTTMKVVTEDDEARSAHQTNLDRAAERCETSSVEIATSLRRSTL